ncbi:MAG: class I adenylate-forming enzyme family protein [Smithellaceae bacterium]
METLFTPDMIYKAREFGARRFSNAVNEYDWLKKNAFAYAKSEAIVDTFYGVEPEKRRRKTWPQALEDVNLWIFNLMDMGLFKGGTIIVQLPNCIEHYYSLMAASKIGCFHLSNHVDFGPLETRQILDHINPDMAIIIPDWHGRDIAGWYKEYQQQHPKLKHIFVIGDTVPDGMLSVSELLNTDVKQRFTNEDLETLRMNVYDPWMIFETAGSSGMPKLVLHGSYWFQIVDVGISERSNFTKYDRMLLFGPMSGTTPKRYSCAFTLIPGTTTILLTEYSDEAACRLTEEEKVTMWGGIPTLGERAVFGPFAEKYDLSSLRAFCSAGAPISREVASKLLDSGIKVVNAYGTSECGPVTCLNHTQTREEVLNTVGKVLDGYGLSLVDSEGNEVPQGEVGEVYIWAVHHGYYNQPEYQADAWVNEGKWKRYQRTGDLGRLDEKGNLSIVGRTKDMILRGAMNIFPQEIESFLAVHPKIRQVAIVKMPDPVLREKACAFVSLKEGAQLTLEEIVSYLESKGLAKNKYPERLEIIAELPMSVGGKVNKPALENIIAQKVKDEMK